MQLHWVFVAEHGLSLVAVGGLLIAEPSLVEHRLAGEPASVLTALHHQLLEFTQTHVHRVGDAIQPSHPLSSPSPPVFSISQHRVFSNESALRIRWPKY